ncbi:hypothetical protein [Alteromonas facilis]|uniref:hypothetical protein n=1 Tax=Alteromonas facilis TaxID=2048004 RepID=UPI000C28B828|nr:hypothetical protein [Alteromonas facilis]
MKLLSHVPVSIWVGIAASSVGLIAFILHWTLWDVWGGPLPGYNILLFPGNLTLSYIWHPLFTEELPLVPKVSLILLGQFVVVTCVTAILRILFKRLFG